MPIDDLARRFSFHPADTSEKQQLHTTIRSHCLSAADVLNHLLPECREKHIAIERLEEVMFWANAAAARRPTLTIENHEPGSAEDLAARAQHGLD